MKNMMALFKIKLYLFIVAKNILNKKNNNNFMTDR